MENLFQKLLILRTPKIGPAKYNELMSRFGNPSVVVDFLSPSDELKDSVLREIDLAHSLNITYLSDDDARYPKRLSEIKNHPPIISVRGNIDVFSKPAVAIVGTRHATGAGLRFVSEMASEFANHGYSVVSGMAMGTDTAAHVGALKSDGVSNTIAVLAGGVDYIWPTENESLYHQIIERGAVVSEMPVGFIPVATNFVQRNRLVAGICDSLILGEADLKSGSMHTARFANDYKRKVYSIPSHPSDARSMGPNTLIREGVATLCMGPNDFFADVEIKKEPSKKHVQNELIDKLGMIPLSESVLAELVKKSVAEIKRDLVVLELQGLVAKRDGGYVKI